eukprot:10699179-Prorocentrum_lima.AAC.1
MASGNCRAARSARCPMMTENSPIENGHPWCTPEAIRNVCLCPLPSIQYALFTGSSRKGTNGLSSGKAS